MELLIEACKYHSDGFTEADITVQTFRDADRLDLGRVGIRPSLTDCVLKRLKENM